MLLQLRLANLGLGLVHLRGWVEILAWLAEALVELLLLLLLQLRLGLSLALHKRAGLSQCEVACVEWAHLLLHLLLHLHLQLLLLLV